MEIIWRPSALEDLEHTRHFIAQSNPEAASRIFDAILAAVRNLARLQESGRPGRVGDTREIVVPHTPYLVAYTVLADSIIVLALLHHAQEWPSRF